MVAQASESGGEHVHAQPQLAIVRSFRFTEHELSIVALVADGMTNRQIGEEMHLSSYTVKEYLSRVMRKLGTATRAETVVRAVREGLLPEKYPGQNWED